MSSRLSRPMRILLDYRPALRQRTGVGEYVHRMVLALIRRSGIEGSNIDHVGIFTSSWRDRPGAAVRELGSASVFDCRIPVKALNFCWNRLGWPPVDYLIRGRYDVVHSANPLLIPCRTSARIVTIHDLDFLSHPERTGAEIRRDYVSLARAHSSAADAVVTSSGYSASEIERHLGVAADRVFVCPPAAPEWAFRDPSEAYRKEDERVVLFLGTLEPRKNIGGLLKAYGRLLARRPDAPQLVLAGGHGPGAGAWLDMVRRPPFAGKVHCPGYVTEDERLGLLRRAAILVLPSFEEGFGMPVLEAMAAEVPVVASRRGALPELVGDAGVLVDPEEPEELAAAIETLLSDEARARTLARVGVGRARSFRWETSAATLETAYEVGIRNRAERAVVSGRARA
jgi:glycosyltransferase involved in cell wall biosynthesis